jgi:hypothetical protein
MIYRFFFVSPLFSSGLGDVKHIFFKSNTSILIFGYPQLLSIDQIGRRIFLKTPWSRPSLDFKIEYFFSLNSRERSDF